ncbi:unnamed protein product, partial [Mesorhabditis belari]|uniref:Saposin B-type domain-containing protein n=1 Tax=Mesorhabditis belari TaxID=2138241 RepID=A0AAF3FB99_9BILA
MKLFLSIIVLSVAFLVSAEIPIERDTPQLCLYCLNQMEASFALMKKKNVAVLRAPLDELQSAARKMCEENMIDKAHVSTCVFITYSMGKYLIGRNITDLTPISSCKELKYCKIPQ